MIKRDNKGIVLILVLTLLLVSFVYAENGVIQEGASGAIQPGASTIQPITTSNIQDIADRKVIGSSSVQFYQPNSRGQGIINPSSYWPSFGSEGCQESNDILMMIPPGGCSPAVVRSDLLEEQNVPVFCKVMMVTANPLIDVTKIRSLRFTGDYPDAVQSIGYYPARAAIRSTNSLVGSPVIDNVGYLVVVLKQQPNENLMPDEVIANITASVDYDAASGLGLGQNKFYLQEMNDNEWQSKYVDYSFWKGKAFVRATDIDDDSATISIFTDANRKKDSINLKKGETSPDIYLPGFYCQAGLNVKLEGLEVPVEKAKILVNDDTLWVTDNDEFLDGRCRVRDLRAYSYGGGEIQIKCSGAGSGTLSLTAGSVELEVEKTTVNDKKEKTIKKYATNELIKTDKEGWNYYVGYIGSNQARLSPLSQGDKETYVFIIKTTDNQGEFESRDIAQTIHSYFQQAEKYDFMEKTLRIKDHISKLDLYKRLIEDYNTWEVPIIARITWRYFSLSKIHRVSLENKLDEVYILKATKPDRGVEDTGIILKTIKLNEDREYDAGNIQQSVVQHYYDEAVDNYEEIILDFPNEKGLNDANYEGDVYGAVAMYKQAELAGKVEKYLTQEEILTNLIEKYPDSNIAIKARDTLRGLQTYSVKDSKAVFYVRGEPIYIDVLQFMKPSKENIYAKLSIDGQVVDLVEDEYYFIPGLTFKRDNEEVPYYIRLNDLREESVNIDYNIDRSTTGQFLLGNENKNLKPGEPALTLENGVQVKLIRINIQREAEISLTPKTRGPRSEAEFTFHVGIEKRAIQLSPEKTKKLISDINDSIEELNETSQSLGEVITAMKSACFATSTILTLKNAFLEAAEGKARNAVMTSSGGWDDICAKDKKDYGGSVSKCFYDKKEDINKDVEAYKNCLEETDKEFEGIRGKHDDVYSTEWLFYKSVNSEKETDYYRDEVFDPWLNQNQDIQVKVPGRQESIALGTLSSHTKELDRSEMRDIVTFNCIKNKDRGENSVLGEIADEKLGNSLAYVQNRIEDVKKEDKQEIDIGNSMISPASFTINTGNSAIVGMSLASGDISKGDDVLITKGSKVSSYYVPSTGKYPKDEEGATTKQNEWNKIAGQTVLISFGQHGSKDRKGQFAIEKAVVMQNGNPGQDVTQEITNYFSHNQITSFQEATPQLFKNEYKEPEIRFHEFAPYNGLPSLVPFDCQDGWYVSTSYDVSGFGKPYADSGAPLNFWICNVGENGREDSRSNDDKCQYVNVETGASPTILGLNAKESTKLINEARNALTSAAQKYEKDGKNSISIGNCKAMKVGAPEGLSGGNCEDFMSPEECRILYNLCDPVICPSDRCNFGGKYRVPNVAQSGIIGSIALCLPNFPEVWVPVCLTGIKAGLDGYISILRSFRDCLQESLKTGRSVGICDEIRSIYLCEFVWRQAGPLLDVAVPGLIEVATGGVTRGGGEYLHSRDSWDYVSESVDFFTNSYAVNAFQAFQIRSTEEAGTEICKMHISARYPTGGDFFDNLVKPDVPVQYHAWFEEIPMTTATLPPTSHYKVYYHIYAGQDSGVSYQVYLKAPDESISYNIPFTYVVDSGYIAIGTEADEAKDFTAPTGYKELCVSINGQEQCGFGKVSTSAALNYMSDLYVEQQATEDISESSQCVAGSPNALALLNPNLQAGAQETIQPEIYNRGIIRVCASESPGIEADTQEELEEDKTRPSSYTRWKDVGFCDNEQIRCWLDTWSVREAITEGNYGVLNSTLGEIDKMNLLNVLEDGIMDSKEVGDILTEVGLIDQNEINSELRNVGIPGVLTISTIDNSLYFKSIFTDLKKIVLRALLNSEKAEALMRMGDVNNYIALYIHEPIRLSEKIKGDDDELDDADEAIITTEGTREYTFSNGVISLNGQHTKLAISKGPRFSITYDGDPFISVSELDDGNLDNAMGKIPQEDRGEVRSILEDLREYYEFKDGTFVKKGGTSQGTTTIEITRQLNEDEIVAELKTLGFPVDGYLIYEGTEGHNIRTILHKIDSLEDVNIVHTDPIMNDLKEIPSQNYLVESSSAKGVVIPIRRTIERGLINSPLKCTECSKGAFAGCSQTECENDIEFEIRLSNKDGMNRYSLVDTDCVFEDTVGYNNKCERRGDVQEDLVSSIGDYFEVFAGKIESCANKAGQGKKCLCDKGLYLTEDVSSSSHVLETTAKGLRGKTNIFTSGGKISESLNINIGSNKLEIIHSVGTFSKEIEKQGVLLNCLIDVDTKLADPLREIPTKKEIITFTLRSLISSNEDQDYYYNTFHYEGKEVSEIIILDNQICFVTKQTLQNNNQIYDWNKC